MNSSGEWVDRVIFTTNIFEFNRTNLTQPDGQTSLTSSMGYLFLAVEIILMIIILVGNGLTIAAILTTPSLQTITYR